MPDAFEEQAVLVAAEQAAAEGDAIAAEGHLRTLLELQTARLGPSDAEVASTVHNLAVVCERAGRIGEAEGLYRRAHAVAAAALPPTDQLVIRCQEDLHAFLEARMTPVQPRRRRRPPGRRDAARRAGVGRAQAESGAGGPPSPSTRSARASGRAATAPGGDVGPMDGRGSGRRTPRRGSHRLGDVLAQRAAGTDRRDTTGGDDTGAAAGTGAGKEGGRARPGAARSGGCRSDFAGGTGCPTTRAHRRRRRRQPRTVAAG